MRFSSSPLLTAFAALVAAILAGRTLAHFDACNPNPCQYGGKCFLKEHYYPYYFCKCPYGYTGPDCQYHFEDGPYGSSSGKGKGKGKGKSRGKKTTKSHYGKKSKKSGKGKGKSDTCARYDDYCRHDYDCCGHLKCEYKYAHNQYHHKSCVYPSSY